MESIIIGIAGGSGSGKSTFTNRLKKHFGDDVVVIYHDNYYRRQDGIPFEERVKVNYDHPDSLETDLQHFVGAVVLTVIVYRTLDGFVLPEFFEMLDQNLIFIQGKGCACVDVFQQISDVFFRKIRCQISADDDRRIDDQVQVFHGKGQMVQVIFPMLWNSLPGCL